MSDYIHINQSRGKVLMVLYGGTDALKIGEGVCYNTDFGTAGDAEASRCNRVERPSVSNNKAFAGVAVHNTKAQPAGRFIEIYEPGSRCVPVALGVDTVIDVGLLTFAVLGRYNIGVTDGLTTEAGRFHTGVYRGRGSAVPRQTVTALLESGMDGSWSLATDGITLTMTSTTGLAADDTVVFLGGADDGTGTVKPGKYEIASITSATVLVLKVSAVDATPTGALTCTGYAYTANPTALCDLLDGDESGGVEFISLPNAGGDNMPHMVGGLTYVCGGVTLAADAEVELAQGLQLGGEKKAFILLAALTTSDFVVDLVTSGIQIDGSTALTEINAIDAANDAAYLHFEGDTWYTRAVIGGAEA